MSVNGERTKIMHAAEIKLPGLHNIENYLAAICATWGYVDREAIYNVAVEFDGVEHRIEFVREKDGVRWYNDSIATTPTRTIAGLESFDQKLVIIAGGYDKKIPFDPLIPKLVERVKTLILIGATADTIEAEVRAFPGFDPAELAILRARKPRGGGQKGGGGRRTGRHRLAFARLRELRHVPQLRHARPPLQGTRERALNGK